MTHSGRSRENDALGTKPREGLISIPSASQRCAHEVRQDLFENFVWMKHEAGFEAALKEEDLEVAHTVWCKAVEDFLRELLNDQGKGDRYKFARGKEPRMMVQALTKRIDGDTMTIRSRWSKLLLDASARCKKILQNCKDYFTGNVETRYDDFQGDCTMVLTLL